MIYVFLLFIQFTISQNYKINDEIIAYAVKIGPEDNPAESYPIKTFPVFSTISKTKPRKTIDDAFFGNSFRDVGFHLNFRKDMKDQQFSEITLNENINRQLFKAIKDEYWVQLNIDNLPVWYHIGSYKDGSCQLYQEITFSISYNNENVIDVNISLSNPVTLSTTTLSDSSVNSKISFTYSVEWKETHVQFGERDEKYYNSEFFNHSIHKYALINSGLLALLLVLLVVLLLNRILASDYNRLIQDAAFDGFEVDVNSEKGWKALHGDVFRPPRQISLLSMICGSGAHLFVFAFLYTLFKFATKGNSFVKKDSTFSVGIFIFVITSPISGFSAVSFGRAFEHAKWLRLAFGAGIMSPAFYIISTIFVSFFCKAKGLSYVVSPFFILLMIIIVGIFVLPLSGLGGFVALKLKIFEMNKCEVSLVPRQIPRSPFYTQPYFLSAAAGLVCTASIIIEIYYIFSSIWHNIGLYSWPYLFISLIIFMAVSSCTSILATYVLLQSENHHWQQTAFCAPAATGAYMFVYAVYYMFEKTKIHGLTQTVFYMANMATFSAATAALAGGVGYFACNVFIHKVFSNLKLE